ncbi:hypothetical protein ACFE04_029226 [Oxalis oulophora]
MSQRQSEEAMAISSIDIDRNVEKDEEKGFSLKTFLWHGGSVYDAWFTCASNQVAQVLLTLPYSFSQMGMLSGIVSQIFYGLVGCWTAYLIAALYVEYRSRKEKENVSFKNHVIQWYEVLDGLLGPYWKAIGLVFNCTLLLFATVIQLIACASNIYYINDKLDKRTWTYIFGACCAMTVFIPSFRNYRIWSFLGLGMTTYTAWYMTIASIVHGQVEGVTHSGARKLVLYFTGATNILYTFGGHAITVEIMHAMWKPRKFKYVYPAATLYVFTLTIPSSAAVYWAFGDQLLDHSNAFSLLPRTAWRDCAVVLMLIHQFITFGFSCTPLYFVWEKVVGMHETRSIFLRALIRLPMVIPIWFLAIIFPFFGPINSAVGALLVSFTVYIVPSLAHMLTFRSASARKNAVEKLPFFLSSWTGIYVVNTFIVVWVLVVGFGLGGWASITNFIDQIDTFGLFAKCYQCPPRTNALKIMNLSSSFRGILVPQLQCSSCYDLRLSPPPPRVIRRRISSSFNSFQVSRFWRQREVYCKVTEANQVEPDNDTNNDDDEVNGDMPAVTDSSIENNAQLDDSQPIVVNKINDDAETPASSDSSVENNAPQPIVVNQINGSSEAEAKPELVVPEIDEVEIASGSPLPGFKPQQLDESMRISKETITILKDQVFGFDTFFVTSHEPYEGGLLFKGNLRGKPAKSYEKIKERMKNKFGDEYRLFLLVNPEDDKPVAVVVPKRTLQPETTAVPEWFAAGAFGLVTVLTLLLRNVPALQSNLMSTFDNPNLLTDGLPGAVVTALLLGVHELGHILAAQSCGVKLGVPYFVPSWQIGSFGAITRIRNIVKNREDLLKVAAAGPLAGFSLGFALFLLGFIIPPSDGLGVVVDASVFHESFLVGGIAKLLLGDVLKEGSPVSLNPLVIWAWAGLLINALNSIPAGEIDGGRISFAIWGRKVSSRLSGFSIAVLGFSSLFSDVAFYWAVLIFFLQRGPIAPLSEDITDPDDKYTGLGILVLVLGLLVCLPYPFPFTNEVMTSF